MASVLAGLPGFVLGEAAAVLLEHGDDGVCVENFAIGSDAVSITAADPSGKVLRGLMQRSIGGRGSTWSTPTEQEQRTTNETPSISIGAEPDMGLLCRLFLPKGSTPMSGNMWHFAVDGQQQGPVSIEQVGQMIARGELTADTLMWRDGMGNWVVATSIPELAALFAPGVAPQAVAYVQPAPQAAYGQQPNPYAQAGAQPGVPLNYYTPSHVAPHYAGFWIRFVASVIDGIVTGIAGAVIGAGMGAVISAVLARNSQTQMLIEAMGNILGIVIGWLYEAMLTSSEKQATLGKLAVGIKVTDLQGGRLSFGRATGRYFAKILSAMICLMGYIMAAFTERKQGLHDHLASTVVVYR